MSIEIYCTCGKGLCQNATTEKKGIVVEPCDECLIYAKDDGYTDGEANGLENGKSDGYDDGFDAGYKKREEEFEEMKEDLEDEKDS